jgi:hypothetical protein
MLKQFWECFWKDWEDAKSVWNVLETNTQRNSKQSVQKCEPRTVRNMISDCPKEKIGSPNRFYTILELAEISTMDCPPPTRGLSASRVFTRSGSTEEVRCPLISTRESNRLLSLSLSPMEEGDRGRGTKGLEASPDTSWDPPSCPLSISMSCSQIWMDSSLNGI